MEEGRRERGKWREEEREEKRKDMSFKTIRPKTILKAVGNGRKEERGERNVERNKGRK